MGWVGILNRNTYPFHVTQGRGAEKKKIKNNKGIKRDSRRLKGIYTIDDRHY